MLFSSNHSVAMWHMAVSYYIAEICSEHDVGYIHTWANMHMYTQVHIYIYAYTVITVSH